MQLFYHPDIGSKITLDETESQHCIKALRHQTGDEINIIDGRGKLYKGIIYSQNHKKCVLKNLLKIKSEPQFSNLHVAIAATKNADRMEWFVEKATEIGVAKITFLLCQNSEHPRINIGRLRKKSISAIKQNQSLWLPEINGLTAFKDFIRLDRDCNKLIAFVDEKDNSPLLSDLDLSQHSYTTIVIGPEGDFSKEEVALALKFDFQMVGLGRNVLRTETAGIMACVLLSS